VSRWRPPQPGSSPYITAQGAARLRAELRQLWKEERPQVTAVVQAAAANGDRSENGDYIYGKKRLREIDARVRYLTRRLESLNVVEDLPRDKTRIYFGAWVEIEDEQGVTQWVRLVGYDEIDPTRKWISIDSPLAKALLGKECEDEVSYRTSTEIRSVTVCQISYKEPPLELLK
jgi:transcription elongation factor GreB